MNNPFHPLWPAQRRRKIRSALYQKRPHCFFCGTRILKFRESTLDHLTPRAAGGTDDADNLVLSCRPCNVAKADQTEAAPTALQQRLWAAN